MANEVKPSPCRIGDCFSRNDAWRAFLQNAVRIMPREVIQRSHLPTVTCHDEQSEAIPRPIPVMANEVKPSPGRIKDCFSRKERSFAMTPGGHFYKMLFE